jgi:hypothetical protein
MKKITYDITTRHGEESVSGWSTSTDGLAVHNWDNGVGWTVDHIASGQAISSAWRTRALANQYAEALAGVTDWTQPKEIVVTPEIGRAAMDISYELRAVA